MEEAALREAYLRKIIDRYAQHINLNEQKSIAELKALAAPSRVESLKKQLEKPSLEEYALACFDFVSTLQTIHVPLPVSFWLSLDEILELRAGDAMDKALLLCALLNARDAHAFLRVVLLQNGLQHALVWFTPTNVWLLDPAHSLRLEADSIEVALAEYAKTHSIKRSVYEFNHEEYREL